MSVFASAASMPTRLPTTPAVGRGMPAIGGGAGLSRPKPKRPRFFFSGWAVGGGLHSSTGGVPASGMRNAAVRGSALGGLPHGSADVAAPGDGAVHVFCAGAGAAHASFVGDGASAGGAHESRTGADVGGVPQGSSAAAGVAGCAGGALQRSDAGAGGALVPHWSGAAAGGAQAFAGGSAGAGASGFVGAGPKIPESALRRSSMAGGVSALEGALQSGGAGVSDTRPHCGATSEIGAGGL